MLGNGYGGFVALQMAIRHPNIATKLILADCGAAFSEAGREAFRNMAAASKAKGLAAITDVAMRRLFAPEFQAGQSRSDARPARGIPAHKPRRVPRRLRGAGGTRPAAPTQPGQGPRPCPGRRTGRGDATADVPRNRRGFAASPPQDHSGLRARPATAGAGSVFSRDRRFSVGRRIAEAPMLMDSDRREMRGRMSVCRSSNSALFAFRSRFGKRLQLLDVQDHDGAVFETNPVACFPGPQLLVDAFPRHPDHFADLLLGDGNRAPRRLMDDAFRSIERARWRGGPAGPEA